MAILKSIATGNFTSASTWATVVAYAAVNNLGATSAFPTTAYNTAPAFTSLSDTVTGVILQMGITNVTISGTFTVELYNVTTSTIVGTCTVNGSDLGTTNPSTTYGGWCFFKFSGGNITLNAAQSYSIRYKASVNGMNFTVVRGVATTDFNRGLVTTTTKAPATNDTCHIMGDFISTGVSNTITVTMDNTDTTLQLAADSGTNALTTNPKGILTWGTSASTNYYLKCAGNIRNYENSDMIIGTSGTSMPSTSTATIEMVLASNGQYGIDVAHNLTTYGASKTVSAKLNADASAGATSLTTDVSTGWKSGDIVGIAGTTRTYTDLQKLTLSADASGTTLTTNALTVAHGGNSTTGVQADLVNLSRNVKFLSQTFASYVYFPNVTQSVSLYYTEFKGFGTATANKYGLSFYSDTITADIRYCSFYDGNIVTGTRCIYINRLITGSINLQSNNFYNASLSESNYYIEPITPITVTLNNCIFIGGGGMQVLDVGGVFSNITLANSNATIQINENNQIGTISNITTYGVQGTGLSTVKGYGNITNLKSWRCAGYGILLQSTTQADKRLYINGATFFGNGNGNVVISTITGVCILNNATITAGTTLTSPFGITMGSAVDTLFISNSTIGSGHTSGDIVGNGATSLNNISLFNVNLNSTVKVSGIASTAIGFTGLALTSLNEGGVSGSNFTYANNYTSSKDTTIFNTSSPSFRITPNTYAILRPKTDHTPVKLAVKSGDTPTVTVAVRKSAVSDGTAYNGSQPRLMLRPCIHAGITDYTIIATCVSANGVWETLSAALPAPTMDCVYEVYIDCDGTTGWINIDDWNTTYFKSTRGLGYWGLGAPFVEIDASKGLITSFFG